LVLPEYLIHVFFCAAEWLTLGLNMPLLAYHIWRWVLPSLSSPPGSWFLIGWFVIGWFLIGWFVIGCRYTTRPVMSGPGLYDPTTIMNADILAYCQKEGWCKLAFYLLSFFYYLYG